MGDVGTNQEKVGLETMHHLYLMKNKQNEQLTQYTYRFDDQPLSPANQALTRLFRMMILAVEDELTTLEVEYIDHQMLKLVSSKRAQEILSLLGATKDNMIENKKGDVVLSRMFSSPLTPEALHYFKRIQDLEELSAYRLLANSIKKVEVYFAKEMKGWFTPREEEKFLSLMEEERIPIKVI